jgi:hypothetical protein
VGLGEFETQLLCFFLGDAKLLQGGDGFVVLLLSFHLSLCEEGFQLLQAFGVGLLAGLSLDLQLLELCDDLLGFELEDLLVSLEGVVLLQRLLLKQVPFVQQQKFLLLGLILQFANLSPECPYLPLPIHHYLPHQLQLFILPLKLFLERTFLQLAIFKIFPEAFCASLQLAFAFPHLPQSPFPLPLSFRAFPFRHLPFAPRLLIPFGEFLGVLVGEGGPSELEDSPGEVRDAVGVFPGLFCAFGESLDCGPKLPCLAEELLIVSLECVVVLLEGVVLLGGDEHVEDLGVLLHGVL